MIWPFRRRKPTPPLPPLDEDWAPGDLAICLTDKPWFDRKGPVAGPRRDDLCRVTIVVKGTDCQNRPAWGLGLERWPDYWEARHFRKVRPVHEACEAEFVALIKAPAKQNEKAARK